MSWCGRISQGWRQRYERYKVDLLSKILEAFADQCCPVRPVWLYMLQRVRCVRAAAVGYKHRAENIINQTTTVKQELHADITSKHLRREAIQIDEVWSQFKTADIPDRSQMHEWKDCEIWSFQRYVYVCVVIWMPMLFRQTLLQRGKGVTVSRGEGGGVYVCVYTKRQCTHRHWENTDRHSLLALSNFMVMPFFHLHPFSASHLKRITRIKPFELLSWFQM